MRISGVDNMLTAFQEEGGVWMHLGCIGGDQSSSMKGGVLRSVIRMLLTIGKVYIMI